MKTFLTLIFVLAISVTVYAQSDTTHIMLEGVLDKTIDRICGGLGEFADQSGMAIEVAWPYAVQYVTTKRTAEFCLAVFIPLLVGIFLLPLVIIGHKRGWDEALTWSWGGVICSIIAIVVGFGATFTNYYLVQHAPEAATVEYLMQLI